MRGRVADWEQHRVVDAMRRAQNPESRARFHQVALDALLPVDMLHIVQELDALRSRRTRAGGDRAQPPLLLAELRRSGERARGRGCARSAPRSSCKQGERRWSTPLGLARGARARDGRGAHSARAIAPFLHGALVDDAAAALLQRRELEQSRSARGARARARPLPAARSSAATRGRCSALQAIVARLRASDAARCSSRRRSRTTSAARRWSRARYGRLRRAHVRDRRVARFRSASTLANLDHPLFSSALFLDHCHLGPEGNRRLALNLLAELGVGARRGAARRRAGRLSRAPIARWCRASSRASPMARPGRRCSTIPRHRGRAGGGTHRRRRHGQPRACVELAGNLQTVVTIAGQGGRRGRRDGGAGRRRCSSRPAPVLVGRRGLVRRSARAALRVYVEGRPRCSTMRRGARWSRITGSLRTAGGCSRSTAARRILAIDPASDHARMRRRHRGGREASRRSRPPPTAGSSSPTRTTGSGAGDIDGAPHDARRADATGSSSSSPTTRTVGDPADQGAVLPARLRRDRASPNMVGMVWVERYGTLLVQDDVPDANEGRRGSPSASSCA